MAQNKMKLKIEALTRVVKHLLQELKDTTSLAQGTLTSFQVYIGEEEWSKVVEKLKKIEEKKHAAAADINEKKLDLNVE